MSDDQQQRGNYYEPNKDRLCANYELHKRCDNCLYQPMNGAKNMTATEHIVYVKQTKGRGGRCDV